MPTPAQVPLPLVSRLAKLRSQRLELARRSASQFNAHVLRDEKTGGAIVQADMHRAWHKLADSYKRLIIWAHRESGKTQQIAIGRTLWKLGKNPNLRGAIISNTFTQAAKIGAVCRRYIEHSQDLHQVFPDLLPGEPWSDHAFTVKRKVISKDPSIQCVGVHGALLGSRLDFVILDDVLDPENTASIDLMNKLVDWYNAVVPGLLTADADAVVIGTAFHPSDLMHALAQQWKQGEKREVAFVYPVIDPATGASRWPEAWPPERIEKRRAELTPMEYARQMLCIARDDTLAKFKRAWIDKAIARGAEKQVCKRLPFVPEGYFVYTGVDLAVSKKDSADLTVLFTIAVHPKGDREVLWIESGRWAGPEIVERIIDTHKRFHSIIKVESNAAQDFIVQFTRDISAVPVSGLPTGAEKTHPEFGIESIAAELDAGKWIIPSKGGLHPEVQAWVNDMLDYDPKLHTGDRLMACYLAHKAARKGAQVVESGRIEVQRR